MAVLTNHGAKYYDRDGRYLDFTETLYSRDASKVTLHENLSQMVVLAERLSSCIPFVRVDFYNVNGRILFGEMTFSLNAGLGKFTEDKWDLLLGDSIQLPNQQCQN